jgi:hypothetical protein
MQGQDARGGAVRPEWREASRVPCHPAAPQSGALRDAFGRVLDRLHALEPPESRRADRPVARLRTGIGD